MDDIDRGLQGIPARRQNAEQAPEPVRSALLLVIDEEEQKLLALRDARDSEG